MNSVSVVEGHTVPYSMLLSAYRLGGFTPRQIHDVKDVECTLVTLIDEVICLFNVSHKDLTVINRV